MGPRVVALGEGEAPAPDGDVAQQRPRDEVVTLVRQRLSKCAFGATRLIEARERRGLDVVALQRVRVDVQRAVDVCESRRRVCRKLILGPRAVDLSETLPAEACA